MAFGKTYWAEAFGMVTDRFGVKWMINCDAPK
jgi:PhnB protein